MLALDRRVDLDPWAALRAQLAARPVRPAAPRPADRPLPIWSLILELRRNVLPTWGLPAYELPIVERPFLGRQSILVNDPDAIRRVLVDNADAYGRTPGTERILHPMIGDGLFLAKGATWRHQRRTMAPVFAPRAMALVAREALAVLGPAIESLRASPRNAVDVLQLVQRLTLEVAGRALFSTSMVPHAPELRRAIERYGARVGKPFLTDFVLPAGWKAPVDWLRQRLASDFKALIERIVRERGARVAGEGPRDLYDILVEARDPETGEGFPPGELRDQVATFLIAGHETTALTLFWSLHLLSLAPEVQDAVADEAAGVDLDDPEAARRLAELPLARAVVSEALRLYPPAFSVVRFALAEDELAGLKVRPRALVVISPWVLGRHRRHWQRPLEFDPTRFAPDAPPPPRFAYLPFGAGPRVCIGAQFALIEATSVLASLVRAFRFERVDRRPLLPVGVVTTYPERAPPFRLVER